jgi:poly-gamma-glutamate synthesis protein (capsule biosynthesis protein)
MKPALLLLLLMLGACIPGPSSPASPFDLATPPPPTLTPFQPQRPQLPSPSPTPTFTAIWLSPAVPQALRTQIAARREVSLVEDVHQADALLTVVSPQTPSASRWIYALVAPFPTVTDDISLSDLRAAWRGVPAGPFAGRPLWMSESTLAAWSALWGEPAVGVVRTAAPAQLLQQAWAAMPSWAIVPFEDLDPRWKVLSVDGQSPIHKDWDAASYPLTISFGWQPVSPASSLAVDLPLPPTNRDPAQFTTVLITGVTALVRATAYRMETKGLTYPASDIGEWLRQADITHISNEVSFFADCPPPNPSQTRVIFCSAPRYLELLTSIGADVIELTGDHLLDYGPQPLRDTLELYRQNGLAYYGGGADLSEALRPLLLEDHGNKFAFLGCNAKSDTSYAKATANTPGPAPCDYNYFENQIAQLRQQGYLVIFTFQHDECYSPGPCSTFQQDFRRMAQAGAVIVSGSQAHFPHVMEFYAGAFIHYGPGNLFFDQMGNLPGTPPGVRREFLDRHVFYAGRHISTELLTAMLEDYARPRPMTVEERAAFLSEYFSRSDWEAALSPFPAPSASPPGP